MCLKWLTGNCSMFFLDMLEKYATRIMIECFKQLTETGWFNLHHRVDILPNEQGNNITPSCVACSDTEVLVGMGAKNQFQHNP
ncbi:heat shock protein 70 family, peptide-binding domain protein [Artemisia annua]|uniref:Heat shock protein 70 family, peptide-binding domain protein n=1 Tax=Artemisia annua TaxID=35608 RepID=A0A2U1PEC3_ARTAN|nr:heat shock protein 70 family, peptide-binding domain protein [Artemisia annua]